jgi:putative DNA methylase
VTTTPSPVVARKKLIEVALPLEAINKAAAREKSIRHGHPSTLHLWWARRPLAAARAVIFAQMVDDPSSRPELFPTEEAQESERQRLFRIIEELVPWENTANERVLAQAREEIRKSWCRTCEDNRDHPYAKELFDPNRLPGFHDPFAGGGALPLEAQRLGLESFASDLNPVAVLINKAMIEIPPKFAGRAPANPDSRKDKKLIQKNWRGAQGLATDVRYYGQWMRDEAAKRIGHLYPLVEVTAEMASERQDLKPLVGRKLTVVAWLWTRTVRSPNPAFAGVEIPLASTFMLSTKAGREVYVEPVIENGGYRFTVRLGKPQGGVMAKAGTTAGKRSAFVCLMSRTPVDYDHIRTEGKAKRMGARLMAIVAEGERGRVYLPPTVEHDRMLTQVQPTWQPDNALPINPRDFKTPNYGLMTFADLFTPRQLVALTTFSDLVQEARERVRSDALAAGFDDDASGVDGAAKGAQAYADAVTVYLAFAISKLADRGSTICTWFTERDSTRNTFARQSIPMTWDYAELNTLLDGTGSFAGAVAWTAESIEGVAAGYGSDFGRATQEDAASQCISANKVVSTDPPYYDNIGYADLSDFFYVWLRRSLKPVFPGLFGTVAVPKAAELVATPYRHSSKEQAEAFFLDGMTKAMRRLAEQSHVAFPVTIYYAFKQSETESDAGTSSTGWETFLDAVIQAGFAVSGTWPMRTELSNRMIGSGTNALASSIVLVCRTRAGDAPTVTRRDYVAALTRELPDAVAHLQHGNIAPVDLAQSAIGPGMAVFTRYAKVLDNKGEPIRVREALALINETLDEALAQQEGDFDADSRFALVWFEQHGFDEGEFGVADVLSRAKNTSVKGMEEAGILVQKGGKVRLFKPGELPADWDPATDTRLTAWESVHHLIRALESGGEESAATLARNLGSKAEPARELAYRLYSLCERKKRAAEALSYNALVQSWPEITRRAAEGRTPTATQQEFI